MNPAAPRYNPPFPPIIIEQIAEPTNKRNDANAKIEDNFPPLVCFFLVNAYLYLFLAIFLPPGLVIYQMADSKQDIPDCRSQCIQNQIIYIKASQLCN